MKYLPDALNNEFTFFVTKYQIKSLTHKKKCIQTSETHNYQLAIAEYF